MREKRKGNIVTENLEMYKCSVCGNLVQVLLSGVGELICCGQVMEKLTPKQELNTELAEKHTPIIEKEDGKKLVRLSYHPMSEEHYIQFIEVISKEGDELHLKYLKPNEKAEFDVTYTKEDVEAVEYCNIHGLWRNNNDK